ncbi:hypothetical protein [Caballeronia sp. Lep1P3]|uniref:hypothetical protein n=1 Tax=Caballeronia sp. Lep1P3 TaxID=2878150 RepID=UPI001FD3A6F2|nr:hypothetical protein [Caballeronia sp. Lep1P3]
MTRRVKTDLLMMFATLGAALTTAAPVRTGTLSGEQRGELPNRCVPWPAEVIEQTLKRQAPSFEF